MRHLSGADHHDAEAAQREQLFRRADALGRAVAGTTSPNPPVGCVLLNSDGQVIGEGATQPAGGVHAEVMALRAARAAGYETRGARAVVTLEPCNHTGRTPPCTKALLEAEIARVDYLFEDPHAQAAGGAAALRAHGMRVNGPFLPTPGTAQAHPMPVHGADSGHAATALASATSHHDARSTYSAVSSYSSAFGHSGHSRRSPSDATSAVCRSTACNAGSNPFTGIAPYAVEPWLVSTVRQRPCVTMKLAQTADGYAAATDLSSQWITGEQARALVHDDRSRRDAIVVGTGTILADNPRLTARAKDGTPKPNQPLRVVMGKRRIPDDAAIWGVPGRALHVATRDPHVLLADLSTRGFIDILIEGGPRLAEAFLSADLVDYVQLYQAPAFLLAGQRSITADPQRTTTIADARRFTPRHVRTLGVDILWELAR